MILYWDPHGPTGHLVTYTGDYFVPPTVGTFPKKAKGGGKASTIFWRLQYFYPTTSCPSVFFYPQNIFELLNSKIMLYFPPWNSSLFGEYYVLHLLPRHGVPCTRKEAIPKKGGQLCVSVFFCRLPCNHIATFNLTHGFFGFSQGEALSILPTIRKSESSKIP